MSYLIEYMKELNLINSEKIEEYVWESNVEELIIFIYYLRELIERDYVIKEYSPYIFVPNDDLSGTGGCSEISCKVERANRFATFSALYSDDVYIQLSLITSEHLEVNEEEIDEFVEQDKNDEEWFNFRYSLLGDLTIINVYRDLISSGIVHITPPKHTYCKECFQREVLGTNHLINIDKLSCDFIKKAKLIIYSYDEKDHQMMVTLKNMDEFFPDHEGIFHIPKDVINHIPHVERRPGLHIKNETIAKDLIGSFIISEFISASYYTLYCRNNGAKLITNKVSDSMFMSLTKEQENLSIMKRNLNQLPQYDMPFINGINMSKILHLREIEKESFNKYRIALNKAVEEQCKTNNHTDWRQIYDDVLYPAFNDLDMKMKNMRSGIFKRTFATMSVLGTVILAGSFSNIIPQNITNTILPIGLTMTAAGGNYLLDKNGSNKPEIRNSDYYFLWRLKK